MRRVLLAVGIALGLAGSAQALGARSVTRAGHRGEARVQPGQVQPMHFIAVTKDDPLKATEQSALATPYMAASTGRWELPGHLPPPIVKNFRRVGVDQDD